MSDEPQIDISAHRKNLNYEKGVLLTRVAWAVMKPLFRFSPRHLYGWRNFLLRLFGAKVGRMVRIYPSANIFYPWQFNIGDWSTIGWGVEVYSLGQITIGANVLISHRAHLCAGSHDYSQPNLPLLTPPITIGHGTWICCDAFIGPGVTVGEGAVVGARAVVVGDVPGGAIVAGNPAKIIKRKPGKPVPEEPARP